jgi:phosphomannomutase
MEVIRLNCDGSGHFARGPEPVVENLKSLSAAIKKFKADLGLACDPDADRLAVVDERGIPIGEELTLALAVKFVLDRKSGKVVVSLATSRVVEAVAESMGGKTYYTRVGEANVVAGMRKHKAIIGGEGNGGVIHPQSHYGRDALTGAALILSLISRSGRKMSDLAGTLPIYHNIKFKAPLSPRFGSKLARLEKAVRRSFDELKIDRRDGVRFDFRRGWFQVRKSNTEPIYRVIVETDSRQLSKVIQEEVISLLK